MNATILDQIAATIEKVVKADDKPSGGRRTTQVMTPTALVAYVIGQLKGAAEEPEDKAMQRLKALRALVEKAKTAFEDSSEVEFQVFPIDTTADQYLTSQEMAPGDVGEAPDGSFAENPEDLHKQLAELGKQIEILKTGSIAPPAPATPRAERAAPNDDLWPSDLNTATSGESINKRDELGWGRDPDLTTASE